MSSPRRVPLGRYRAVGGVLLLGWAAAGNLAAQMLPPTPAMPQKSYADYYMESVQNYRQPPVNVRDYTIDKYYYRNPNISPYLNLARRSGPYAVNNYYRYVLPEVERRAAGPPQPGMAASSSPVTSYPMTGPIHTPVAPPTPRSFHDNLPYFNNYYNNFGGLKR